MFGVVGLLFTGCGSSSATTTPDFGNLPTGTTTSTVAVAANASISAVPSLTTVSPGSSFDVTIQVTTADSYPGDAMRVNMGSNQSVMQFG